ncbi:MAG TPA: glycosyltransferase family 4 protein [Solirubrobacteraceae bacterium]|jgi:glycosyltransferase involved in cell wall biosynthesis|nr:glycosyltransferase family 4 protein [Solirubrobacteraceae bacterium]
MRVHIVDPSAYTPPYDHALSAALAAAGADVELFTSRFAYAAAPSPHGYVKHDAFYRSTRVARGDSRAAQRARRVLKLAEHVPDMLRYRRAARGADVVHFQWLTVQQLDARLLPPRRGEGYERSTRAGRPPLVLTAHDVLPREGGRRRREAQRRLYDRFDAVVAHTEHGRSRLTEELGVDPERVHVIAHGAFAHLAELPAAPPPFATDKRVVLFFGLLRPYKGLDVLLQAWRGIDDAELWIVGMPRMDVAALTADAPPNVRLVPRFVADAELPAYFARADLVVLPYREIEQSGVLFTALAFGKALLVSDVGGFAELAERGAAHAVAPGDPRALHDALTQLLADPAALASLGQRALAVAHGEYSWQAIAARTLALYRQLLHA